MSAAALGLAPRSRASDAVALAPPVLRQAPLRDVPPPIAGVLASRGERLDGTSRALAENQLGYDFGRVRIHRGPEAASSAAAMGALAYTAGDHVVFAGGRYAPTTNEGRSLLIHELAHVVQQGGGTLAPSGPTAVPLPGGGTRIGLGGTSRSADASEREAEAAATRSPSRSGGSARSLSEPTSQKIQQARFPLPTPIPMCGRTLTHIDVEPPRWRDLQPCKPAGFPVFRINIVGRDLSVPTPGRGPQVFNLHVGIYRDPTTSRWCGIAHDSKGCLAAHCLELGCFPTLSEVLDAIKEFLKALLVAIGILALLLLIAAIIALLGEILVPATLLATGDSGEGGEGGVGSEAGTATAAAPEGAVPGAGEVPA